MKDNINTSLTLNRKIVIEVRFDATPRILDLKGTIIENIKKLNLFPTFHWELGDSVIAIKDAKVPNFIRNQVIIELNRFAFVSTKIDSVDSFYSKFQKILTELSSLLDLNSFTRIGCRIQGTYKVKSSKYDNVLKSFIDSFPSTIFIEDFPSTDLLFRLNYQNGMYQIGPIKDNDGFLKREFPYDDRNNTVGVAIDTDNFLQKISEKELTTTKIKDVVTASLAVEKSLYEKLKDF